MDSSERQRNSSAISSITNRVLTGSEQGLLGFGFPPGLATNALRRNFYVNYTRQGESATVISRFQVTGNANLADADSEQVLLVIPQPFPNHKGGQLAFGPDGYLYVGMGDGGYITVGDPLKNSQNPRSLLGKLLRIDVESSNGPYVIPPDNPFVGDPNYAHEIWAVGLCNPWRFSFDRETGDSFHCGCRP